MHGSLPIGEVERAPSGRAPWLAAAALAPLLLALTLTLAACGAPPGGGTPDPTPDPQPSPSEPVVRFAVLATNAPGHDALGAYAVGADGRWTLTDARAAPPSVVGVVTHPDLPLAYVVRRPSSGAAQLFRVGLDDAGRFGPATALPVALPAQPQAPRLHPAGIALYLPSADGTVWQYALGADGALAPLDPPSLSVGPPSWIQSLRFHPTRPLAYVTLPFVDMITTLAVAADGTLQPIDDPHLTLPTGTFPYGLTVAPNDTLYVTSHPNDALLHLALDQDGHPSVTGSTPTGTGCLPIDLVADAAGEHLYLACNASDTVRGFAIAADRSLDAHATGPIATDRWPLRLALDPEGHTLHVMHDAERGVRHLPIGADGRLAAGRPWPSPTRGMPRDLAFVMSPERARPEAAFVFLSTSDTTALRGFDLASTPPGATPTVVVGRHGVTTDPSGRWLYVATGSSLLSYNVAADGALFATLPPGYSATDPSYSTLTVDPVGRFLYATEPLAHRVAIFRIQDDGAVTLTGHVDLPTGSGPGRLVVHPSGRFAYLAAHATERVHQYAVGLDGTLAPLDPASVATSGAPLDLAIHPDGHTLHTGGSALGRFSVGSDGRLSPLPPSTIAVPSSPTALAMDPLGRVLHATFADAGVHSAPLDADGGASVLLETMPDADAAGLALDRAGSRAFLVTGDRGTLVGIDVAADGSLVAPAAFEVDAGGATRFLTVVTRWR